MNVLTKRRLLIATVIAAIACWQWYRFSVARDNAEKALPSLTGKALVPNSPLTNVRLATSIPQKPVWSREETLALIHLKLHQWLETQASGGDDNDHSLADLEALLAEGHAVEIIKSLTPDELNTPFGMEVLGQWSQADLVTATNWVAANPQAMEDLTAVVAQDWAKTPGDLEDYTRQLPDSAWKQSLLLETGSLLSANNPEEAITLAQQMSPPSAQANFLQSVAGDWISRDPRAALDWIRNEPDPALREQLVAAAAKSYALTDPEQAAAWLASSVKTPQVANEAALNIVETWSVTDPKAAANWASLFPNGETKNSALNLVSNRWLQTDPESAALWLQNFPGKL